MCQRCNRLPHLSWFQLVFGRFSISYACESISDSIWPPVGVVDLLADLEFVVPPGFWCYLWLFCDDFSRPPESRSWLPWALTSPVPADLPGACHGIITAMTNHLFHQLFCVLKGPFVFVKHETLLTASFNISAQSSRSYVMLRYASHGSKAHFLRPGRRRSLLQVVPAAI